MPGKASLKANVPFTLANAAIAAAYAGQGAGPLMAPVPAAMARGTGVVNVRNHINLTLYELTTSLAALQAIQTPAIIAGSSVGTAPNFAENDATATVWDNSVNLPASTRQNLAFGVRLKVILPRDIPQGPWQVVLDATAPSGADIANTFAFSGGKGGSEADIILLPTIDLNGTPYYSPMLFLNDVADVAPGLTFSGVVANANLQIYASLITRSQNDFEGAVRWRRVQNRVTAREALRGGKAFSAGLGRNIAVRDGNLSLADLAVASDIDAGFLQGEHAYDGGLDMTGREAWPQNFDNVGFQGESEE